MNIRIITGIGLTVFIIAAVIFLQARSRRK